MTRKKKTMDGNTAAAHVAYAFTDVAAIYPITPSSVMAELVDAWSAAGQKNLFGQTVRVAEMQSEAGAAGAVHGSLSAGALTTTFTASQGLLLMIPNMYKIAGSMLPGVIHVSARNVAAHALSIFGEHSDVMACRATGYAMLASTNPQEVMDLSAVVHLAALKSSAPFLHFFDGFRTSHEIRKVDVWDYADLDDMLDREDVERFRARALSPDHPVLRGSAQNSDIYFQVREASNKHYADIPAAVEACMAKVNAKIGTNYQLFNYYGAPDAETVMVAMGSVCDAIEETVDYLNAKGEKVGLIKVRLFRPFVADRFLAAVPATCKNLVVIDRCKEPGAAAEPLCLDVSSALLGSGLNCRVIGGRYGLASKDTTPGGIIAAFKNGAAEKPIHGFTINIVDDVTNLSLPITEEPVVGSASTVACKFWGIGSDGTVGANKNTIKIIGDHTDLQVQAYFQYDSKKSGGVTISHLRFGADEIKSTYYVNQADFVACHVPAYIDKYKIVRDIKPGGTFLVNCAWDAEELGKHLTGADKRRIAQNNIQVYAIDAVSIAKELGLGNRTNSILQAAFFKLSKIIPIDDAVTYMKDAIAATYGRKGEKVVKMNHDAVDAGLANLRLLEIPADWANAPDVDSKANLDIADPALKSFIEDIMIPVNNMDGDSLPVSTFTGIADGTMPQGTAAYEKRGVANDVPVWIPENCIQCNQCSMVCPHAVIRPFVLTPTEAAAAPAGLKTAQMNGKGCENYRFTMSISSLDCTGCGSCVNVCPAKTKALAMAPLADQTAQQEVFDYCRDKVQQKEVPFAANTVKGSQFLKPYFEFSGACAGCGETPYVKLISQLFGERMYVANATGCSSIYSGSAPSTPYTIDANGHGPAWENSLFEDAAEFGYGINLAATHRRARAIELAEKVANCDCPYPELHAAAAAWLEVRDDVNASRAAGEKLAAELEKSFAAGHDGAPAHELYDLRDMFAKKSMWIIGGDGWAYDIGYGGLDHVLASGENINIMVLNTEVYSNTGGQASKASRTGQVAQFAAAGKELWHKDLAAMAMSYGHVYVAQVSMGANYQQCLKAISEAEAYPGPSLIIGYAPCINHGLRAGMGNSMLEMKAAVESGYWHLFRYDPQLAADGKNPFQLDSKAPSTQYMDFLNGEVRYSSLKLSFPERAEDLFAKAEKSAAARYEQLRRLAEPYKE
ncbi:MAG: pyruvate:ferredoxin (flavodoxin) oxidoreductase [Oscillospiraceae bacterium]|nr:pyruvate:ferredoxin (flavodoxin) oxidoreductase [Oscillospiraceae bacterium]